jgi:hypothetical protein
MVGEIKAGRPFIFTIKNAPISHMLVAKGVQNIPGDTVLAVNDPEGYITYVTYTGYRSQQGLTIQGIAPLPNPGTK